MEPFATKIASYRPLSGIQADQHTPTLSLRILEASSLSTETPSAFFKKKEGKGRELGAGDAAKYAGPAYGDAGAMKETFFGRTSGSGANRSVEQRLEPPTPDLRSAVGKTPSFSPSPRFKIRTSCITSGFRGRGPASRSSPSVRIGVDLRGSRSAFTDLPNFGA